MSQIANALTIFNPWKAKISVFCQPIKTIEVKDETSQLNAQSQLREAAALRSGIEQCRKDAKEPYFQAGKLIDAHAKQLTTELDAGITHLKSQLGSWEKLLAQKRDAELKVVESARREKEEAAKVAAARAVEPAHDDWSDFLGDAAPLVTPEKELAQATAQAQAETELAVIEHEHRQDTKRIQAHKVAGSSKVWKFEVTDAASVPRAFLMVDERAIRAAVAEGAREIAGVRIYEDVQIRASRY